MLSPAAFLARAHPPPRKPAPRRIGCAGYAAVLVVGSEVLRRNHLTVELAMAQVDDRWQRLTAAAASQRAVVSGVGWPSGGAANGAAVPSPENAARFFLELATWGRAKGVDYFWFAAADEAWEAMVAGEVGAHWGLWHSDGTTLKPGMQAVFAGQKSVDTWAGAALPAGPGARALALIPAPDFDSTPTLPLDLTGMVWATPRVTHR